MPYVKRDQAGKVTAVFARPQEEGQEYLEADHVDVVSFKTPDWDWNRRYAEDGYGGWQKQMEILVDSGIEGLQAHAAAVKIKYPKS